MRNPARQAMPVSHARAARPTPNYNDEVSSDFIGKQQAYIESHQPEGFQLTPVSGDGW